METKQTLDRLKGIADHPFPYLRNWKIRTGKKILGYFCTYSPEEIIQAAGLLPVRILGSEESISLASKHLQSYSCSLVQSSLEAALRGELDFLDGTVFTHTCDSIQRLSDIWAENLRFSYHWDVVLPVKLHSESARTYLIQELRRFRQSLQEFIGHPISDEDLRASIALTNENRSLLRELYLRRPHNHAQFQAAQLSAIVKTATFLPKDEHNAFLKELLSRPEGSQLPSAGKVRLFLAGSVCIHPPLFDLIEDCGAWIVGDDLCTGWRYSAEDVSLAGDPVEALAERFFRRVPCPCKHNPAVDRGEYLRHMVEASQAQGVVFFLLKFCDPHAFDYPDLKEKLERQKIPTLLVEIEPGSVSLGAVETRVKAFVETLGG